MNNIYIAYENTDLFNDKEILSLDKSAQTQVTTQTTQSSNVQVNSQHIGTIAIIAFSVIFIVVLVFFIVSKLNKKPVNVPVQSAQIPKTTASNPVIVEKKEQKIKLNFATPNNLNGCIRMFLERTKNK